jgi:tubulin polyglutamylase TTLL6/13
VPPQGASVFPSAHYPPPQSMIPPPVEAPVPEETDVNNAKMSKKKGVKKRGPPPVVVNLKDCHYRVLSTATVKCGWGRVLANPVATMFEWDVYWTDSGHAIENMVHIAKPYQRINHFPGMNCIYRKHHLSKSMSRMKRINEREYSFFPRTWLLPEDAVNVKTYLKSQSKTAKDFYIVKPASSCQGKGIYLVRNWEDIRPSNNKMVIQKYLHNPLLIDGLKFDLRIYVLIISCEPLRILVFREGLVRFCTVPYSPPTVSNMSCAFMHITNYAVNKANINFVQNNSKKSTFMADSAAATQSSSPAPPGLSGVAAAGNPSVPPSVPSSSPESSQPTSGQRSEEDTEEKKSHKRSLTWLWEWMKDNEKDSDKLWKDICDIVVKTVIAAQVNISVGVKNARPDPELRSPFGCFELLGFDIILQEGTLTPSLLEVNHTPSFKTDSALDKSIKLRLIMVNYWCRFF